MASVGAKIIKEAENEKDAEIGACILYYAVRRSTVAHLWL
jgi:hypothetical protein